MYTNSNFENSLINKSLLDKVYNLYVQIQQFMTRVLKLFSPVIKSSR